LYRCEGSVFTNNCLKIDEIILTLIKIKIMDFSKIIVGVMRWGIWGANHSESGVQKLIETSLEEDLYTFDHADIYGGYTTEELFGNAFSEMKINREKIQLITKCGICMPSEKKNFPLKYYNYSKEYILNQVDESLKNLKTDYIDLLLLHRPSPLINPEEIAAAFGVLRSSGKVGDFGVSNFTTSQFDLISKYFPQLVTNQVEVSLTETKAFYDGTIDQMMLKKLQPMAWSVMGTYFSEDSERTARIKSVLEVLTKKYNAEEAQLLLAFLLKHPSKIIPIIGTSKVESIKSLKKSLQINLEIEDWFSLLEASLGHDVP
jgi:predicted oxidoreductase